MAIIHISIKWKKTYYIIISNKIPFIIRGTMNNQLLSSKLEISRMNYLINLIIIVFCCLGFFVFGLITSHIIGAIGSSLDIDQIFLRDFLIGFLISSTITVIIIGLILQYFNMIKRIRNLISYNYKDEELIQIILIFVILFPLAYFLLAISLLFLD